MSQQDSNRKWMPLIFGLILVLFISGLSFGIGSGGGGVTSLNDQIQFHATAVGNSTGNTNLLISTSWTAIQNETMVISLSSITGDVVTSITDSKSDKFTKQFHETQGCLPCFVFEIWTGNYFGASGTTNRITIHFNNDSSFSQNMFLVSTYVNVGGVGNATGTTGSAASGSFQIETEKAGSSIVGGMFGEGQAGNNTCPVETAGPQLTQRVRGCGIRESPGIAINGDMEDNMTILPNNTFFTYSTSWDNNNHVGVAFDMGAIELVSIDQKGSPNVSTFCTTSNGLCITSQYKINAVSTATSANAIGKGLALNTAYCTGITTAPLTTTAGKTVFLWGNYGGVDLNTTSAKLLIQLEVSTAAPSTTFGVGQCATGGTIVGTGDIFFSISGTLSSTNAFSVAVNGFCNAGACGGVTVYGWIEITAQNFALGSLGFDQIVSTSYSMGFLDMMEIK